MILLTNKEEAAALTLHMSVMRADFRNLLKRQYKAKKGEYLKAYDYVKSECEKQLDNDLEYKEQHLNVIDLEVLTAFLNAYVPKLKETLEDANAEDEKDGQVFILTCIQQRCKELLKDVA